MNAPEPRIPLSEPKVELVPTDTLWPSSTQVQSLRRKRFNPDAITELAASFLKIGQLQPILVRPQAPMMIEGRKYEIVLGERRFLAAQQAGFKHIQATIAELNDAEVLEAQLIENLQREDLHPLEEAEGYRELMAAASLKKEDLGERIGKSRSWVYSRLALLKLLPEVRAALEAGSIDISRALVLANIGDPVHQAKGLELASRKHGGEHVFSVRDLRSQLGAEGFTISLKLAPFDVSDRTLEPGSCEGCEFRSVNHDPAAEDPDVCTNRSCYEKKIKAHSARALKAAEQAGRTVLRGDEAKKISAGKDRYIGYVDIDQACDFDDCPEPEPKATGNEEADDAAWSAWDDRCSEWQPRTYRELLRLGGHTVETVLLEGKGKRAIELAPIKELQRLLKKQDIKVPAHIAQKPAPRPAAYDWKAEQAKQEAARKKREEAEAEERKWRVAVLKAIVAAKPKAELKGDELRAVAHALYDNNWTIKAGLKHAGFGLPNIKKCTEPQLLVALRLAIAAVDIQSLDGSGALAALAKACKVDVAKIKKQVAAEGEK